VRTCYNDTGHALRPAAHHSQLNLSRTGP
jgi:hypothetical protein